MPQQPTAGVGKAITNRPTLVSYDDYADAQAAVDRLSDAGFPVRTVAIVGSDLRSVEVVLGRMSWGRAALGGLAAGAWVGLLIGLLLSLFGSPESGSGTIIFAGLLYGAAFGIIYGLISYAVTRGRRDFVSRQVLQADRYDVVVDAEVIGRARQILFPGQAWPPPLATDDGSTAESVTGNPSRG